MVGFLKDILLGYLTEKWGYKMPTICFKNGKTQSCEYSIASEYQNMLDGNPCEKAYDPKFLELAVKIDHIEFEPLPQKPEYKPTSDIVRDEKLHKIMDRTDLKGYAKFKAIGDYLRTKHLAIKAEV